MSNLAIKAATISYGIITRTGVIIPMDYRLDYYLRFRILSRHIYNEK